MFICYFILDTERGVTIHPRIFPNFLVLTSSFSTLPDSCRLRFCSVCVWMWWRWETICIVMCRKNICESPAFLFSYPLDFSALEKKRNLYRSLSVVFFSIVKNKCKTNSRDLSVRFDKNNISFLFIFTIFF